MSSRGRWLGLTLAVALFSGCAGACDGQSVLADARAGKPHAMIEAGEWGDPPIPSSQQQVPSPREAFSALVPLLSAAESHQRLRALEALRRLSRRFKPLYRDQFPGTFDPLLSDDDPEIRWRAAWGLGRLELSSPALREAVRDPVDRVAERAVWAVGRARDDLALGLLVGALDRGDRVAQSAVLALGRVTSEGWTEPQEWRAWARERGLESPAELPRDDEPVPPSSPGSEESEESEDQPD